MTMDDTWVVEVDGANGRTDVIYGRERDAAMVNLYWAGGGRVGSAVSLTGLSAGASLDGRIIKNVFRPVLPPGGFYARMVRPFPTSGSGVGEPPSQPAPEMYGASWRAAATTLKAISASMNRAFLAVEPDPVNRNAFGHEIRQLLIVACTEVENQCKAILKANGYSPTTQKGKPRGSRDWKMADYEKVIAVQRLPEWTLRLALYPTYPALVPFADRDADNRFNWYRAYNDTKHDREANFGEATLEAAVSAVAAVFVLFLSQFGKAFPTQSAAVDDFAVDTKPTWQLDELYVPVWVGDPKNSGAAPPAVEHRYPF